MHQVETLTSDLRGAGTDANVFLIMHGTLGDGTRHILTAGHDDFNRGVANEFVIDDEELGELLEVWMGSLSRDITPYLPLVGKLHWQGYLAGPSCIPSLLHAPTSCMFLYCPTSLPDHHWPRWLRLLPLLAPGPCHDHQPEDRPALHLPLPVRGSLLYLVQPVEQACMHLSRSRQPEVSTSTSKRKGLPPCMQDVV